MRPKRKRFEPFEIPSSQGPVRIEIADGSVCIFDPEGESYYDGWATADDIASDLVRWARLALRMLTAWRRRLSGDGKNLAPTAMPE
jgi:hypothetical protein